MKQSKQRIKHALKTLKEGYDEIIHRAEDNSTVTIIRRRRAHSLNVKEKRT